MRVGMTMEENLEYMLGSLDNYTNQVINRLVKNLVTNGVATEKEAEQGEKVYIGETEILSHEDLEDQEQTILFGVKMPAMKTEEKPESVKTGDDVWFLAAVLLTVVISGSMVVADLVYRRKRRK